MLFSEIKLSKKPLRAYRTLTPGIYARIRRIVARAKRKQILHISSTALGGGVAELLRSQVPLERSAGLDSRWLVLTAPQRFFEVTKKIHNLLQGGTTTPALKDSEKRFYLSIVRSAGAELRTNTKRLPDIIIVHDPQPLPLIDTFADFSEHFLLRLHIDLSTPHKETLDFLKPWIQAYRKVIITSPLYRPPWLFPRKTAVIMPAIDPFTEKNCSITHAREILAFMNIHPDKPIVSQVSRFDKWKDPMGVIETYYRAKNKIPNLQLILAGAKATDDPEAAELLERIRKHARGDPDIFFYTQQNDIAINAIQTASDVVLQKSLREGFGLTVTEAMWKGRAVIGGKTTGIALQIKNRKNGFLVSSVEEAASVLVWLLRHPEVQKKIGQEARKTIQKNFLLSRLILDYLKLYLT